MVLLRDFSYLPWNSFTLLVLFSIYEQHGGNTGKSLIATLSLNRAKILFNYFLLEFV